jgi:hypothetical protein
MLLKDLFINDVSRDIPPVVYFHEQDPARVAAEVSEYIITGGYPDTDPRYRHTKNAGIHEQFVRLLRSLKEELQKKGGPELPAVWISGFYGSGKSSFAKLLGLALDGMVLPDGCPLAEALLHRDESPKAKDLRDSWEALCRPLDPIAVVFDVGAVARDDEHIHAAVRREVQRRLDYCSVSHRVADHELKLELDGQWQAFLDCAQATLNRPWQEAKTSPLADEDFSLVLHEMNPTLYTDPLSWYDSRAGANTGVGSSVDETTRAIASMLQHRAPGKTLFIVVDEVSQYIFQNTNRMLALQSFVSALGQRLKGQVWLLATGQQKLEDSDDESNISKLKDRFPPKLRVHLAPTNIRDVVHRRLLKKQASREQELAALFEQHRADLKLYAYHCETISREDFLEIYPLLPGYVDLLMQITSNLRTRSTQAKGDDHAIRGLLQLLGELFREQRLGEQELGQLISLDNIFEVQQSALDNDIQTTLGRLFSHEAVVDDAMAIRVAKAVALLELIQEQEATTASLVSQCLYDRLGRGNQESAVTQALEKLRSLNLLSYSEKTGYQIQSSAGQEWARERDSYSVTADDLSEMVASKLKDLLGTVERPRYKSNSFRWAAYYSDGRQRQEERLQVPNELAVVTVDFRYLKSQEERQPASWVQTSDQGQGRGRIFWVVGKLEDLESQLRELARSRHMVNKYQSRLASLSREKQRLLFDEQSRCETLENKVKDAVAAAFLQGELYFCGRQLDRQHYGTSFASLLEKVGESLLPDLYSRYVETAVTPTELTQLLEPQLSGPSHKFMPEGLGILELDAGKYAPTCQGEVPARIEQFVRDENGISGSALLSAFGGPPYGYPADVVKACLAGLLRASKVRIRPESGAEVTSVRDPGARDLFTKDRDLKRADILPPSDTGITGRDRVAICRFFEESLGVQLDRDNDAIADAVFTHFPSQAGRLRELEQRYNRLPNRPPLPTSLIQLQQALEKCVRSRQVEPTLNDVKRHLDTLRDGLQELGMLFNDLTDQALTLVTRGMTLQAHQVAQLRAVERLEEVAAAVAQLEAQLALERPWRDIASLEPQMQVIEQHYQTVRLGFIEGQERRAETVRDDLQQRQGYYSLVENQRQRVLQTIWQAVYDTTAEALYPPLLELRDTAQLKLGRAAEEAHQYLSEELSKKGEEVVEFRLNLQNREVSSPDQVEALVEQLRHRLLAQLQGKSQIRLRLLP